MKIAIIGTGYVGLVTGASFASTGNTVYCCDVDKDKIALLSKGSAPFFEPGLDDLIKSGVANQRLFFTTETSSAISKSEIIFIAVGTPTAPDGSTYMSNVWNAAHIIAKSLKGFAVVVTKSTVPMGATERIREIIKSETDEEFAIASNPEFLKEGDAVNDCLKPDRVVVGTDDERVRDIMTDLYAPFVRNENPIVFMDIPSAELTKYAANALLATKVSFINEIANICELVGADINQVRRGIGFDRRIGFQFLFPGIGFGGSCFPKDLRAIINTALEKKYEPKLISATYQVNADQKKRFIEKIKTHFSGTLKDKHIAVWGISFKPRTDDIREAPALTVIDALLEQGVQISIYDPQAMANAKKKYGSKITYAENNYKALENADALVICTEWNDFRNPDFEKMKSLMATPVIFDGRNLYRKSAMKAKGFTYYAIGLKH